MKCVLTNLSTEKNDQNDNYNNVCKLQDNAFILRKKKKNCKLKSYLKNESKIHFLFSYKENIKSSHTFNNNENVKRTQVDKNKTKETIPSNMSNSAYLLKHDNIKLSSTLKNIKDITHMNDSFPINPPGKKKKKKEKCTLLNKIINKDKININETKKNILLSSPINNNKNNDYLSPHDKKDQIKEITKTVVVYPPVQNEKDINNKKKDDDDDNNKKNYYNKNYNILDNICNNTYYDDNFKDNHTIEQETSEESEILKKKKKLNDILSKYNSIKKSADKKDKSKKDIKQNYWYYDNLLQIYEHKYLKNISKVNYFNKDEHSSERFHDDYNESNKESKGLLNYNNIINNIPSEQGNKKHHTTWNNDEHILLQRNIKENEKEIYSDDKDQKFLSNNTFVSIINPTNDDNKNSDNNNNNNGDNINNNDDNKNNVDNNNNNDNNNNRDNNNDDDNINNNDDNNDNNNYYYENYINELYKIIYNNINEQNHTKPTIHIENNTFIEKNDDNNIISSPKNETNPSTFCHNHTDQNKNTNEQADIKKKKKFNSTLLEETLKKLSYNKNNIIDKETNFTVKEKYNVKEKKDGFYQTYYNDIYSNDNYIYEQMQYLYDNNLSSIYSGNETDKWIYQNDLDILQNNKNIFEKKCETKLLKIKVPPINPLNKIIKKNINNFNTSKTICNKKEISDQSSFSNVKDKIMANRNIERIEKKKSSTHMKKNEILVKRNMLSTLREIKKTRNFLSENNNIKPLKNEHNEEYQNINKCKEDVYGEKKNDKVYLDIKTYQHKENIFKNINKYNDIHMKNNKYENTKLYTFTNKSFSFNKNIQKDAQHKVKTYNTKEYKTLKNKKKDENNIKMSTSNEKQKKYILTKNEKHINNIKCKKNDNYKIIIKKKNSLKNIHKYNINDNIRLLKHKDFCFKFPTFINYKNEIRITEKVNTYIYLCHRINSSISNMINFQHKYLFIHIFVYTLNLIIFFKLLKTNIFHSQNNQLLQMKGIFCILYILINIKNNISDMDKINLIHVIHQLFPQYDNMIFKNNFDHQPKINQQKDKSTNLNNSDIVKQQINNLNMSLHNNDHTIYFTSNKIGKNEDIIKKNTFDYKENALFKNNNLINTYEEYNMIHVDTYNKSNKNLNNTLNQNKGNVHFHDTIQQDILNHLSLNIENEKTKNKIINTTHHKINNKTDNLYGIINNNIIEKNKMYILDDKQQNNIMDQKVIDITFFILNNQSKLNLQDFFFLKLRKYNNCFILFFTILLMYITKLFEIKDPFYFHDNKNYIFFILVNFLILLQILFCIIIEIRGLFVTKIKNFLNKRIAYLSYELNIYLNH
ncbi:hypothetical protein PFFCH_02898 [Plasmodium falciparum FCH/4]|uniref:Uncharacterized protein n=1 Tax=Plasmodium falciparum FCH/4 TaxID=1036724 RepID=A0A024VMW4_PLAFA|nr:hypothetical protein PFFCH_02898 [Plasmodium falciparum FCH/4]